MRVRSPSETGVDIKIFLIWIRNCDAIARRELVSRAVGCAEEKRPEGHRAAHRCRQCGFQGFARNSWAIRSKHVAFVDSGQFSPGAHVQNT